MAIRRIDICDKCGDTEEGKDSFKVVTVSCESGYLSKSYLLCPKCFEPLKMIVRNKVREIGEGEKLMEMIYDISYRAASDAIEDFKRTL